MKRQKYLTTAQVLDRFAWGKSTLQRRQARDHLPFPRPALSACGAPARYDVDEISAWEEQERERIARERAA